jgi:hypothetical protein
MYAHPEWQRLWRGAPIVKESQPLNRCSGGDQELLVPEPLIGRFDSAYVIGSSAGSTTVA